MVGSALTQTFTHVTVMMASNIVAMVLTLPLLAVVALAAAATRSWSLFPLGVCFLIGILPNPAAAGVQYVAHELAKREDVSLRDEWVALRTHLLPALRLWLVSSLVMAVLVLNVIFYAHFHSVFTALLQILWVSLLLLWVGAHLYAYPLLFEQDIKRFVLVYRNALLLILRRPIFTFAVCLVWVAVLALGASTGLVTILGLALAAAIQQNATLRLLPAFLPSTERR